MHSIGAAAGRIVISSRTYFSPMLGQIEVYLSYGITCGFIRIISTQRIGEARGETCRKWRTNFFTNINVDASINEPTQPMNSCLQGSNNFS